MDEAPYGRGTSVRGDKEMTLAMSETDGPVAANLINPRCRIAHASSRRRRLRNEEPGGRYSKPRNFDISAH